MEREYKDEDIEHQKSCGCGYCEIKNRNIADLAKVEKYHGNETIIEQQYQKKLEREENTSNPTHILLEKQFVVFYAVSTFLLCFIGGNIALFVKKELVPFIMGFFGGCVFALVAIHRFGYFINYEALLGASKDNRREEI